MPANPIISLFHHLIHHSTRYLFLLLIGFPIVGLWPFNFTERNNVSISPNGGLVLARHGTAYTASSPGKLDGLSQLAVLIDFETSSDGLSAYEKIFSYSISQTQMNFIFGQWKDAFLPTVRTDQKVQGIKLGVENALQQGERTKFLLNWDGRRIRLYQDGATKNARDTGDSAFSNWSKEYPLIAGTDANGRAQWKGTLYEVAIFDRALSPKEINAVASGQWSVTSEMKEDKRPLIHYVFNQENTYETEFRGGKALGVRDLGKGEPADLVVPEQFVPYKRQIIDWDPHWIDYKSNWLDLVVNILGFIPFGMLLEFAFRKVTGYRLQATGVGTNNGLPASGFRFRVQSKVAIAVILAVAAGFAVSFAIEYLQAYMPSRDSSLRDLITNTLGTLIGAVAAAWLLRSDGQQ